MMNDVVRLNLKIKMNRKVGEGRGGEITKNKTSQSKLNLFNFGVNINLFILNFFYLRRRRRRKLYKNFKFLNYYFKTNKFKLELENEINKIIIMMMNE